MTFFNRRRNNDNNSAGRIAYWLRTNTVGVMCFVCAGVMYAFLFWVILMWWAGA